MGERDRKLYAVLIDADNVPAKYAGAILKEVTSIAEPALRKVYGDWTSPAMSNWKGAVREHGMVGHQETANTTGKNANDIGLVIDAMDILHGGRLDGFVIVSSDSDFTRLASRIREHGLDVVGMGQKKAPPPFVAACQRFIYLENLDSDEKSPGPATRGETESRPSPKDPKDPTQLILVAMDKIGPDDDWYALGPLGQYIVRDNPDFDARTYGKKKLSDLVQGLKRFETRKIDSQWQVRRRD